MKLLKIMFTILIFSSYLISCSNKLDYPKLRDVPTNVKPSLSFNEAKKELAELEKERDVLKGRA